MTGNLRNGSVQKNEELMFRIIEKRSISEFEAELDQHKKWGWELVAFHVLNLREQGEYRYRRTYYALMEKDTADTVKSREPEKTYIRRKNRIFVKEGNEFILHTTCKSTSGAIQEIGKLRES